MMISKIVLIPFFASSVMARGRGGGGSVSIDDNWDAPGVQKALMAFAIIFAVFSLVQFVYILKNFTKIPFLSPRAPYIILSITTFFTFLWYLLYGILTRLRDDILDSIATGQVNAALVGFFTVVVTFQPAAVLLLLQQRGSVLQASRGNAISVFPSLLWKRIVDWALIGLTFIIHISYVGNYAAYIAAIEAGYSSRTYSAYIAASKGLSYTLTAFFVLLCLDVIITSIVLFVQAKRAQWTDPVTRRICLIGVPLFAIYALEWLITTIYYGVTIFHTLEALYGANLADLIIESVCRLGITALLIVTMTLPGVEWVPVGGASGYPDTPGQWSDGTPVGNQPVFVPQQPYYQQQQPYWNQQQTYFQQQPYYQQQQQPQQSPYSVPSTVTRI